MEIRAMLVAEVNYDAMKNLFYSPWLYLVIPFVNSQQTFKIPNDLFNEPHTCLKEDLHLYQGIQ